MDVTGKQILHLLVFLLNGKNCWGNVVAFFGDTEYKSTLFQAQDSIECRNLPEAISEKVHSVLTDGCTVFFEDLNCIPDRSLTVSQVEKKNLSEYDIQNGTRSFRRCSKSAKEIRVEVFRNSNLTGLIEKFTINHNHCNGVNWKNWGVENATKALSVKTSGCIVAYLGPNCDYAGVMIKPSEGDVTGEDFSSYKFVRDYGIGSIRACNLSEKTSEIKFFTKNSTKELLYLGALRDEYSLLPENFEMDVGSVWSSECVLFYTERISKDGWIYMHILKVDPNTFINLQMFDAIKTEELIDYRRCSSTDEEKKVEVKFYGKEDHEKYLGSFVAQNSTGCTDHPFKFIKKSEENLRACIEIFNEPGCLKWETFLPLENNFEVDFLRKRVLKETISEDLPPLRSIKVC